MTSSVPRRRLLILDDDPLIGQTISAIATLSGLDTRYTSRPQEFFQAVEEWNPTHIALDLIMPQMDGIQVIQNLALLGCTAGIIITSGVDARVLDAAGRLAAEHGLNIVGVVAKPFTPTRLRQLLLSNIPSNAVERGTAQSGALAPATELDANELRRALLGGAIIPYYQPKVVCATGALAGFEVLARWRHPDRGLIPPARFVPLAEAAGLIDELTLRVTDQALRWFAPLCTGRNSVTPSPASTGLETGLQLAVNISARTLSNTALFDQIRARCRQLGIAPEHLSFELTESSAIDDPTASLDLLTQLRMHGFHLALDDFGAGFSSMLQLVRLPVSEIKIDKSFVMTAMQSKESRTVTRFIVDLGRSLGLRCTAEGVENAHVLAYLRSIGCDLAQGYAIAQPMPGEAALQWMGRRASLR
ncbi:MAG: EAL domain-containing response regulator [Oscillochloridaceae bacterium]|nr:EAL domain-containing response regulator [Chloroflexaceae bacterium]MDW8390053.1 EAL domain-containing response regulator [Oscillochloridaceae bacterium]